MNKEKDVARDGPVVHSPDGENCAWASEWQEGDNRVFGYRVQTYSREVGRELESLTGTVLTMWGINHFRQVYLVPEGVIRAACRAAGINFQMVKEAWYDEEGYPHYSKRKKAPTETA